MKQYNFSNPEQDEDDLLTDEDYEDYEDVDPDDDDNFFFDDDDDPFSNKDEDGYIL
jgi:hypothetical protein